MMNDKETWIIVGLGNPGSTYAQTRHNAGFCATDVLSAKWNLPLSKRRFEGLIAERNLPDRRIVLSPPQTFMNLSGECVR